MFNRFHHQRKQQPNPPGTGTNGHNGDLEASRQNGEPSNSTDTENLSEYVALDRYISTFREDGGRPSDEDPNAKARRIPWWKFWKSAPPETEEERPEDKDIFPDSWLDSDIHAGIPDTEIDARRRRMGWNELTSEKENPVMKFLSYFTGPILYGEYRIAILITARGC